MAGDGRFRRAVSEFDPRQACALAEARVQLLEDLYQASGRGETSHPRHGTYTGLWEELCLRAGQELMGYALLNPAEAQITLNPAPPPPPTASGRVDLEQIREVRQQAFLDAAISIGLVRQARQLLSPPADLECLQGAMALLRKARAYRSDYFLALSYTEKASSFAALANAPRRAQGDQPPEALDKRGAEHEDW